MRYMIVLIALVALHSADSASALTGTPGVEVIFLNTDCVGAGHTLGGDCVETLVDLRNMIWGAGGIHPTASSPLIVDIGPGTFTGTMSCNTNEGYVTFRGAGRERSIITTNSASAIATFAMIGCRSISFQDLTLENAGEGASNSALLIWDTSTKCGPITVTNSNLLAPHGYAWYETAPTFGTKIDHFVFGSRLVGGKTAIISASGRSWFYGSDLVLETWAPVGSAPTIVGSPGAITPHVVVASKDGDVRVFGSSLRVIADAVHQSVTEVIGVRLPRTGETGGEFHMHGGIINVTTKQNAGVKAIGILNEPTGGLSHTLATAFVVMSAVGTDSVRLSGGGNHQSPLLWQSGTAPPNTGVAGTVVSKSGQDIYVETDCNSAGCNAAGTDPHLMIYKDDCPNSKWFDVVRDQCRD